MRRWLNVFPLAVASPFPTLRLHRLPALSRWLVRVARHLCCMPSARYVQRASWRCCRTKITYHIKIFHRIMNGKFFPPLTTRKTPAANFHFGWHEAIAVDRQTRMPLQRPSNRLSKMIANAWKRWKTNVNVISSISKVNCGSVSASIAVIHLSFLLRLRSDEGIPLFRCCLFHSVSFVHLFSFLHLSRICHCPSRFLSIHFLRFICSLSPPNRSNRARRENALS